MVERMNRSKRFTKNLNPYNLAQESDVIERVISDIKMQEIECYHFPLSFNTNLPNM